MTVTCNGIDCSFMYVASVYYNLNNIDDNESSAAPLHMCSRWVLDIKYVIWTSIWRTYGAEHHVSSPAHARIYLLP